MKIFYADVIASAVYERLKACRKHVTFIKFHAAREHETQIFVLSRCTPGNMQIVNREKRWK